MQLRKGHAHGELEYRFEGQQYAGAGVPVLLNAGRSLYLVSVVLLNRASDSRFLRIVVSTCLQGAPAVGAHDDFQHAVAIGLGRG